MNVEELVVAIKNGEEKYIDDLWSKVSVFVRWQANEFYYKTQERARTLGYTEDDLFQVGFFALWPAIKAFDGEYKFLTYLGMHLKNQFNHLAGIRTEKQKQESALLINSISLDESVETAKNPERTLFADIIPDPDAESELYAFIENDAEQQKSDDVRKAVSMLNKNESKIITEYYFNNSTLENIALKLGLSYSRTSDLKRQALNNLKKNSLIQKYKFEYEKRKLEDRFTLGFGFTKFKETGMSSQEAYMIKLEELEKRFGLK